jgi:hypothetical protein
MVMEVPIDFKEIGIAGNTVVIMTSKPSATLDLPRL